MMEIQAGHGSPPVGRGVGERDVWQAADALLVDGQRPTIERVRQRIGRGSPNTISLHLEGWFAGLGRRLADPAAFVASGTTSPGWPAEVADAMAAAWEVARRHAGVDAQARLAEAREQARREALDANARADAASRRADATADELRQARGEEAALAAALAEARAEAGRLRERLDAAESRLADEALRRDTERTRAAADRAGLARQLDAAEERAAAAERRRVADVGHERDARAQALRQAEALADRLNAQVARASSLDVEIERLRVEAARRDARHPVELDAARRDERRAVERANAADAEAAELRAELERLRAEHERWRAAPAPSSATPTKRLAGRTQAGAAASGALRRAGGRSGVAAARAVRGRAV